MEKSLGNFYLTDDNALILSRCKQVTELLNRAYWVNGRDEETMGKAMENSLNFALFEKDSNRLAGYARVITDHATMYYLCDVIIHEDYRALGLGKALVEHIVSCDERIIRLPGTLKTRDAQSLYERFGFEECSVTCMQQQRKA